MILALLYRPSSSRTHYHMLRKEVIPLPPQPQLSLRIHQRRNSNSEEEDVLFPCSLVVRRFLARCTILILIHLDAFIFLLTLLCALTPLLLFPMNDVIDNNKAILRDIQNTKLEITLDLERAMTEFHKAAAAAAAAADQQKDVI